MGKVIKNDFLLFKIMKNNLQKSRFGFIVSKKVSKKASQRNKIKRRLRKIFMDNLKELKESFDVVVVALSGIEKKEFSQIEEAVSRFFKKIKIIK